MITQAAADAILSTPKSDHEQYILVSEVGGIMELWSIETSREDAATQVNIFGESYAGKDEGYANLLVITVTSESPITVEIDEQSNTTQERPQ